MVFKKSTAKLVLIQKVKNYQLIIIMNFEEDNFLKSMRKYKTHMRKNLIKLIRIVTECVLKRKRCVKFVLCNEIEYLMFEFFAELLIKFIIYHKNDHVKIESCQFRNGKCYLIKVSPDVMFQSNRSLIIKEREILIVQEMGWME
jgi:hypothetical protein